MATTTHPANSDPRTRPSTGPSLTWPAWKTTVRVQTVDPAALRSARRLVDMCLRAGEKATDGGRSRAEIRRVTRAAGRPVVVSHLLADLVTAALDAAAATEGAVDPTVGNATAVLAATTMGPGTFPVCGGGSATAGLRPARGWQSVHVDGTRLTVPAGVHLDLSATAKAFMAMGAATFAGRHLGLGVLVDLGGDIAASGLAPSGGWLVDVGAPSFEQVRLHPGEALATSHGRGLVDPRTGRPIPRTWQSISVRGAGCLGAKALAVAAHVAGPDAVALLESHGVAARLEYVDGTVVRLTGWDGARTSTSTRQRHLAAAC